MNFINPFWKNKFRPEMIFQKEGSVFREKIVKRGFLYIYIFVNYVIFVIIYAKQRNVTNAWHCTNLFPSGALTSGNEK